MTADLIITIVVSLAFAVGMVGIVVPVIPGSIIIALSSLLWASVVGGWTAWIACILIVLCSVAGIGSSYVLTGRRLKQLQVPSWVVFLSVIGAVIGFFLIPGPGLLIGFIAVLFLVEFARRKNAADAWRSTFGALKSMGIGVLVELGLAMVSASIFAIAIFIVFYGHFPA